MQFMLFTFLLTMSSLLLRPSRAFHLRPLIARRSLSIRSSTSTNAATSQEVEDAYSKVKMEDIVSLCKRRGFVYQNSVRCVFSATRVGGIVWGEHSGMGSERAGARWRRRKFFD